MAPQASNTIESCWTLLYHKPGGKPLKGRGEFIRLMFEDSGTQFTESSENLYGPSGTMDAFRGSPEAIDEDVEPSTGALLYPPAIRHKTGTATLEINQVAACMIYLGDKLGYSPLTDEAKARANCILLNSLDFISEGRGSFHPVKNSMSYHDQKEEGDRVSKEFAETRLLTYLHHFNKVVKKNGGPQKPIAGEGKDRDVTYADFALFHVLDAAKAQFNTEWYDMAWDKANIPEVKGYHAFMLNRPSLQDYFRSDRCAPYAGDSMM